MRWIHRRGGRNSSPLPKSYTPGNRGSSGAASAGWARAHCSQTAMRSGFGPPSSMASTCGRTVPDRESNELNGPEPILHRLRLRAHQPGSGARERASRLGAGTTYDRLYAMYRDFNSRTAELTHELVAASGSTKPLAPAALSRGCIGCTLTRHSGEAPFRGAIGSFRLLLRRCCAWV